MTAMPHFALDIGTRKVIGLLSVPDRDRLRIVGVEKVEHRLRSMFDGQIHDVPAVAEAVAQVKVALERRSGVALREVAVAAAGRALRTCRGEASRECPPGTELDAGAVFSLELEAVQAAQRALAEDLNQRGQAPEYHYVGHSVLAQSLDGLPIGNLLGQRGHMAAASVIATFLPRGVLDSLVAVLERVGLELTALTLEPIAAIGAVVPASMRHLHLALVDIGAGTSDIAVTDQGTVVGYDMVPMAGDEVTEALSAAYLLEFPVAEQVKRALGSREAVSFANILGQACTVASAEAQAAIGPVVERLAASIAERIIATTGRPPTAVMLVGGGSQTSGLPAALAAKLKLPLHRVGVRGRDAVRGVIGARQRLKGPDAITPIGIALSARRSPVGFAYVYVSGFGVRLFNPARLQVADALLAAGIDLRELQPRMGKGLTVWVNGELCLVPGQSGTPGQVQLDGQPVPLTHPVRHRDALTVTLSGTGRDGAGVVGDLAAWARPMRVTVDKAQHRVPPLILVNGVRGSLQTALQDNDQIEIPLERPAREIAADLGLNQLALWQPHLGGTPLSWNDLVPLGASLELILRVPEPAAPAPFHLASLQAAAAAGGLQLTVNGESYVLHHNTGQDAAAGQAPIFAHLLSTLPMVKSPPAGKTNLVMSLNGGPAEFTSPIRAGDRIELSWE